MQSRRSTYREEAIPLITYDQDLSQYIVNEQAIEIIQSIPQPIGIVGVAGMYRTGKSYLLNRMLLNRSDGFGVGPTVNPCTKGLWMWGKPLLGQTIDGETCSILVIDSEGLGALDEDSTHDTRIFSLVILLSSCFIYNSVGSIDENAIQNLSLVVNLTKNIQLKSQPNQQQSDLEDLAQYFPQFYWVVRDFTLQLVDQDGESITSKEYLEKSLQMQKGFSDGIEQKNRIRRLLSTFFKERDCITLVRPLTKEENLQNLEKLDFDKLRPEFFEQVINLRKRILNRIKPKTINDKVLSGAMYVDLIRSYTSAINNGAVPAIESAWTYICNNECQKAIAESLENYEQVIKELLHNKIPLPQEELKSYNKMAKDSAISVYKQRQIGDLGDEFFKELLRRIKQKFLIIKQDNERDGTRLIAQFIQSEFCPVDRKLKIGEYRSFAEFDKDIKLFYQYFLDNGPRVANRQTVILEFLQRSLAEGAQFFVRQLSQEQETSKNIFSESQRKLESELKDARAEGLKDKNNLLLKLAQIETEKAEVEMREQLLRDSINELKQQKERMEKDLKTEMLNERNEYQRQISEMKEKLLNSEESSKDLERNTIFGNSEFEKEKALLLQKVAFYEKNAEEFAKKEKDFINEIKLQKKEHQMQQKDLQNKLDTTTRQLQQKINDLQEKLNEIEIEMTEKEERFDNDKKRYDSREKGLVKNNIELNEQVQQLQREIKELKRNEDLASDQTSSELRQAIEDLQNRLEERDDVLKQKDDQIKQMKSSYEKDKALALQKIEFMDVQLQESKKQIEENRKAHDAIMKAFENSSTDSSSKVDQTKLQEIREQHKKEIKQLEQEWEVNRKKLQSQIDTLTEKNGELELKVKFETGDLMKELESLKEQLSLSEEAKLRLMEQNKLLDGQKLGIMKEVELRYQKRIKQLEAALEDADSKTAREVSSAQTKAEESLTQLKNFYEIERERLEKRICEEKEKNDKKFQTLSEEYYQKIKESEQNYEDEIEQLKDDLREQESHYTQIVQQYEHEIALKQQTIETLEKYIKETKESLISLQNNNNNTLEQQMNSFSTERKGLVAKIDTLSQQVNTLQKENMSLQQKKDMLESDKLRKEGILEQARREWNDERKELLDKLDEQKNKLQKLNDEYLEKKIEYGREVALSNQQNEFLNKKIEDLSKQVDTQAQRYEEKYSNKLNYNIIIELLKTEYVQELQDKLDRAQEEKQQLESKYEKMKKTFKEQEYSFNKQIAGLERDKAINQEKLQNLEQKKQELETKLRDENSQLIQQNQLLKEQLNQEKRQLQSDLDKYKSMNLQLEQDKNEIMTCYERDKALWEGKFQFLEQQKEQAKQDLVDALKKFERARNNEKDEQESNLNELLMSVERKYQAQIEEANQAHQRVVQDYEDKIRRIQKELKSHKDKMLIDQHGKIGNQLLSEKKFAEMLENEKKLQQEIENVKADRDHKLMDYQKSLDAEREQLKGKIQELEQKYKEIENRRSSLIFEFEKERAKWNLDRDHLVNMKNELQDQVEKLEKKKEFLLRENEKLKNEQRATRRSVNVAHNMTSNTLLAGNKGRNPGLNNVSTIGLSKQQLSPTHSNNTSTSSANISVLGQNQMNKKSTYGPQNQSNLVDITNFSGIQPYEQVKQPNSVDILNVIVFNKTTSGKNSQQNNDRSFYALGDEVSANSSMIYGNKDPVQKFSTYLDRNDESILDKMKSNDKFNSFKH